MAHPDGGPRIPRDGDFAAPPRSYDHRVRYLPDAWRGHRLAGLPAVDVVLSGVLAAVALASALARRPPEGPLWATVPVALVMTIALACRSRAPLIVALAVSLAAAFQTLPGTSPGALWAFAVFLAATYSVAVQPAEGRAALGGVVLVGGLFLQEWADRGSDYLFIVLVFGGTWVLGRAVLTWRNRAVAAAAEGDDKARLAVMEERLRLARELHDIVAHSLGVIAVQAEAAQAALAHDRELARAPLAAVLLQAREAITEMRQLLGVLRSDGDGSPRTPQPGLDELEELVAGFRSAGLPVQVSVEGPLEPLSPMVDLTTYRIAQEALTNVLKHAGKVPTTVAVQRSPTEVRIEVVNTAGTCTSPSGGGTGHGLTGIRERVTATGGSVSHGPLDGGGFRLSARLPVGEVAS